MTLLTRTPQASIQQGIRRNTFNTPDREPKDNDEARQRLFELEKRLAQALGENFRDADDAQRAIPFGYPRELTAVFELPLYLSLTAEPRVGIFLARCRRFPDDELPTNHGSAVEFVWDGVKSRARITRIEGLTPGTQKYRFNFWVVG